MVLGTSVHTAVGEKEPLHQSYQALTTASSNNDLPGKYSHCCKSNKSVMEVTTYFMHKFKALSTT